MYPLGCWDWGFGSRLGRWHLSLVSVMCVCVCGQVEFFASCWSLVQKSPTECSVSECDHEPPIMRRTWHNADCCAIKNYSIPSEVPNLRHATSMYILAPYLFNKLLLMSLHLSFSSKFSFVLSDFWTKISSLVIIFLLCVNCPCWFYHSYTKLLLMYLLNRVRIGARFL